MAQIIKQETDPSASPVLTPEAADFSKYFQHIKCARRLLLLTLLLEYNDEYMMYVVILF